jgi:hypothetical protein
MHGGINSDEPGRILLCRVNNPAVEASMPSPPDADDGGVAGCARGQARSPKCLFFTTGSLAGRFQAQKHLFFALSWHF